MTTMEVSDREKALLLTMRRMRNGSLDRIGVVNGEPSVIIATTQRIDFQREDELRAALSGGFLPLILPITEPT